LFDFTSSDRRTKKLIELTRVHKSLGGRKLFGPLSLTLSPGDKLGLLGGNGSGKSTLLKLLAGALPPDAELHGELTAARFTFDPRGRYAVESKDDMKKRLKRSPNKADAFNLAVSADAAPALDQATADDFADLMPRVE
jgi:ATPase subunit of ABC transporter with duplicated ATPase domains